MLNQLRTFLMPESSTSLKLVFDNIRNYAICGALLVYGLWVLSQSAKAATAGNWQAPFGIVALQMSSTELKFTAAAALVLTAVLTILNVFQIWLLLFHTLLPPVPANSLAHLAQPPSAKGNSLAKALALTIALSFTGYWAVQVFMGLLGAAAAFVAK